MTAYEAYVAVKEQIKDDILVALGWNSNDRILDVLQFGKAPTGCQRIAYIGPMSARSQDGAFTAKFNTGGSRENGTTEESWTFIIIIRLKQDELGSEWDNALAQMAFKLRNQLMSRQHHTDQVDTLHLVSRYDWGVVDDWTGWAEVNLSLDLTVVLTRYDASE